MPITQEARFHGVVFYGLVASDEFTAINKIDTIGSHCYIVNHDIGLLIKHSSVAGTV